MSQKESVPDASMRILWTLGCLAHIGAHEMTRKKTLILALLLVGLLLLLIHLIFVASVAWWPVPPTHR